MKKFMGLVLAGVAVFALSGCDTGSDGVSGSATYLDVHVLDLDDGYIIDGRNDAGEFVTFEFCHGDYKYYSGPDDWYGHFSINGDRINMFDDTPTAGSYRIDTFNNYLEVGERYDIDFQNDEIIVEQITEDLSC